MPRHCALLCLGLAALLAAASDAAELPFTPQAALSSGLVPPVDAQLADLDGDGDQDIVFSSRDANLVGWLEQTVSGFTQRSIQSITSPLSVLAADLDADGDLDVATTSDAQDRVRWYESDGASPPAFTPHDVSTQADSAQEVYAADLNRDGNLDLVSVAGADDEIAWYQNDGASPPGFTRVVIDEDPDAAGSGAEGYVNGPGGVAVFDPDRDGDPDVAVLGLNLLAWFENTNGLGTSWTPHTAASGLSTGTQVQSADLDDDGDPDLAAAIRGDDSVYWYENDGTPGTGTWTQRTVSSAVDFGTGGNLSAGDVDEDGDVDVVAVDGVVQKLFWFESDGGAVPAFTAREVTGQRPVTNPPVGDLDGDGDADLVALEASSAQIRWIENESIHRSAAFFNEATMLAADQPEDVQVGDVDGDGDLDALAVWSTAFAWLENTPGDGSAWTTQPIAAVVQEDGRLFDLDQDRDLDVLVGAGSNTLDWYENTAGDGSAFTKRDIGSGRSVAIADLDRDGDPDVLAWINSSDSVVWYQNTGSALTWSAAQSIETGVSFAFTVEPVDLDGDGDLDVLMVGDDDPPRAAWFENDGSPGGLGDWTEHAIDSGSGGGSTAGTAADIDADGDLDVAVYLGAQMRWYANQNGLGTSWSSANVVSSLGGGGPRDVVALDLDADGDMDLARADHPDRITWYENVDGAGASWTRRRVTGLAPSPRAIAAGDVDGDGDVDVLGATENDDAIAWYENQGGQLALPTADVSRLGGALAGGAEALLRIDAAHRGRSGDSGIQVTALELLFEQALGDPLSSAEVNALVDELRIYQDDGSGGFDGADTQIFSLGTLTLGAGLLALDVSSDVDFVLAQGVPRAWFVVAVLAADAATQSPNTLRVTHLTEATSTAEDGSAGVPVALEFAENDAAAVTALAPGADADADGLSNQTELDTENTDPFDADTDGDGLSDGAEVNTHASDPLDPDSDGDDWLDGSEVALGSSPTSGASTPAAPAKTPMGAAQTIASFLTGSAELALADVDGDGNLDVLMQADSQAKWWDNSSGDGSTWTQRAIPGSVGNGSDVVAADLDRDGDVDAATFSATPRWHENLAGDGLSWSSSVIESTNITSGGTGHGADLDRDGDPDLIATLALENALKWYENQGGTSFVRHSIAGVHRPLAAVAADLDRDGDLDLLSSAGEIGNEDPVEGQDQLAWHENVAGDASSWSTHVIESDIPTLGDSSPADLDGDGDLDVLIVSNIKRRISWLENVNGDASLWVRRAVAVEPDIVWNARSGDVDGDGDLDVYALSGTQLAWYENVNGDGSIWAPRGAPASASQSRDTAAGDLDGDGDLDLVAIQEGADTGMGTLIWSENLTIHRSAAFGAANTIDAAPDLPNWVSAGDLDRDGDQDAIVINVGTTGGIRLRKNDGAGGFGPANLIVSAFHARVIRLADMDRDGDPDLVTAATGTPGLAWLENTTPATALSWTTRTISGTYPLPFRADVGDIDGDGDPDVMAGNSAATGTPFKWFENTAGNGSAWSEHSVHAILGIAGDVRLADVDGDADLDVFYDDMNYSNIGWLENTAGDGSAWTDHSIEGGSLTATPNAMEPVDFDRDGDVDVVVASVGSNNSAWFENANGAGTSWTRHSLGSPARLFWLRASDLDLDGDLDVLGAGREADDVFAFENTAGDGSTWTVKALGASVESPLAVDAADLDGDGDSDLLATGFQNGPPDLDGPVVWLENDGGQFALPTNATAYQGMVESRARQVLQIDSLHRGRAGDSDAELAAIELRLEDGAGVPLSGAQANALFGQIQIRLGTPTGTAIATAAPPFALSSGVLTLGFSDADPNVQLDPGQASALYVVPTLDASASTASPSQFRIVHLTESSSRAEDASADLPLTLEFEANTSSGPIQALPASGDFDSDGLSNAAEADTHGTDPGNPDTDGDGAGDGLEVNTLGSDPLDTDSDGDGLTDGAEVTQYGTSPTDIDSDDDGYCDGPLAPGGCTPADNCPAISNAGQTNSDPLSAGDACQCGDVTGDGPLTAADYQRAREFIVNRSSGFFDAESCDVNGDVACDVEDLAVLDRAVAGIGTVIDACGAYTQP